MTTDRTRLAALAAAAALALGVAAPAAAQTPACMADPSLSVVVDSFIPGYAVARRGATGVEIAVNEDRGLGLGRQTQDWLLERQCYLVGLAGDSAPVGPTGLLEFSLAEHTDADCAAFNQVVSASGAGGGNALRVIDRDVSVQARGTYWDVGMGDFRNIASSACQ